MLILIYRNNRTNDKRRRLSAHQNTMLSSSNSIRNKSRNAFLMETYITYCLLIIGRAAQIETGRRDPVSRCTINSIWSFNIWNNHYQSLCTIWFNVIGDIFLFLSARSVYTGIWWWWQEKINKPDRAEQKKNGWKINFYMQKRKKTKKWGMMCVCVCGACTITCPHISVAPLPSQRPSW